MDLPLILIGGALSGNQAESAEERVKTFLEASEVPSTLRYVLAAPIRSSAIWWGSNTWWQLLNSR